MAVISIIIGDISKGNGTERAVTNLANSLCTYGDYKVNILSCSSKTLDVLYFELHSSIRTYNLNISLGKKINYFKLQSEIRKVCIETQTNFLLGTTHALNSIMVGIKIKGMKKIACEHMNYAADPIYSRIARRYAYPKLDAVVLLTENDRKNYMFCKNTYVIPNSVPQMTESSTCENKILLAIGRYTKQKGFDMLVNAFALVHKQMPDWKVRIIGQGEDEGLLKKLIKDNDLQDKIELIPPKKNIKDEYLQAGMYVLSSRWEGFVLVLIEAKSAGLPSVSFDCPEGPADILRDGTDGFLVEPENIEEFGSRILQLASDEKLRKEFGHAAKEDIKRLSPEKVFYEWDRLFKGGRELLPGKTAS